MLALSVLQTRKNEGLDKTKGGVPFITPEYARGNHKQETGRRLKFPRAAGGDETRETALDVRVSVLSADPKWDECHKASHLFSDHHLNRPSDDMKLSKFPRLPKIHRRARSKTRSEIGPIENQSGADPAVPRPTESTPNSRVGVQDLSRLRECSRTQR